MNQPIPHGEDVALFIDWENFKISLATGHRIPNVSALKEEVSNHGRVVVAKAYADWVARTPELRGASQFINDPPALYAAGIEPVYVPTRLFLPGSSSSSSGRTTRIKNSVDVKMTADCIECAHTYPNISTYVLVSGDSDFIHVINTLRTMGKRVIIIGVSWATSRRLSVQVDGLILYDADVDPITPPQPVTTGNGRGTPNHRTTNNSSRLELAEVIRAIEEIVREERQTGGTPLLTSIKQRLMRRFTGFDEKMVGFSGFKKLMVRVAQDGNIKLVTAGLVDWATMADEPTPEEGSLEQPDFGEATTASQGRPNYRNRRTAPPLAPVDSASQDSASQDSASQDSASQDSASQDSASQDSASQDSASQDSASQDSASQDSASQDSASQDSASQARLRRTRLRRTRLRRTRLRRTRLRRTRLRRTRLRRTRLRRTRLRRTRLRRTRLRRTRLRRTRLRRTRLQNERLLRPMSRRSETSGPWSRRPWDS